MGTSFHYAALALGGGLAITVCAIIMMALALVLRWAFREFLLWWH